MFIILDKYFEVFATSNGRVIPLNVAKPGDMLGLFETIDSLYNLTFSPPWSVSSGARSIFLLPKITDQVKYKKLCYRYGFNPIDINIKTLNDHWQLFKLFAQHPDIKSSWSSDMLVFTKPWFDKKHNDSLAWRNFMTICMKELGTLLILAQYNGTLPCNGKHLHKLFLNDTLNRVNIFQIQ